MTQNAPPVLAMKFSSIAAPKRERERERAREGAEARAARGGWKGGRPFKCKFKQSRREKDGRGNRLVLNGTPAPLLHARRLVNLLTTVVHSCSPTPTRRRTCSQSLCHLLFCTPPRTPLDFHARSLFASFYSSRVSPFFCFVAAQEGVEGAHKLLHPMLTLRECAAVVQHW